VNSLSLQAISEHNDIDKTRKSLWLASAFTLIVSNATFQSDQVDIFGLQVTVSQAHLVAVGRLAITILLLVFLLHCSVLSIAWYRAKSDHEHSRWETERREEIGQIETQLSDPYSETYDWRDSADPWQVDFHDQWETRNSELQRLARWSDAYASLIEFLLRYALTLAVSLATLINPLFLSRWLELFSLN
jgi:hypothetical protein